MVFVLKTIDPLFKCSLSSPTAMCPPSWIESSESLGTGKISESGMLLWAFPDLTGQSPKRGDGKIKPKYGLVPHFVLLIMNTLACSEQACMTFFHVFIVTTGMAMHWKLCTLCFSGFRSPEAGDSDAVCLMMFLRRS